jgi:hypothetical protein
MVDRVQKPSNPSTLGSICHTNVEYTHVKWFLTSELLSLFKECMLKNQEAFFNQENYKKNNYDLDAFVNFNIC